MAADSHDRMRCRSAGGLSGMGMATNVFLCLLATLIVTDAYSVSQSGANIRPEQQQQTINNGINGGGGCQSDRLVVYKVVLHTYWTRDLFPKHYPDWRPVAQWTKTVGKLCCLTLMIRLDLLLWATYEYELVVCFRERCGRRRIYPVGILV